MARTFLVTGGAGFIGSHLVDHLLDAGHEVRVLDNLSTGSRANLAVADRSDRFTFIEGDIRDLPVVERACRGADAVFHQAALGSVPRSMREPVVSADNNVMGSLNVLDAARRGGVRRVVYASSSSVYGERGLAPRRERDAPAPLSPYAVTKLAGELFAQVWARAFGVETVGLRYFNVFGPRQNPDSAYAAVIPRFIARALRREPLEIYGDGRQSRDFTYVDNVVRANIAAAEAPGAGGEVLNVGCGRPVTLRALVESLARILGRPIEFHHAPARPGDVTHSRADITRSAEILGFTPHVEFEEGLRRTCDAFRAVETIAV